MKLNLLPTYVSKEGQQRAFIVLAVLVLLLSIAGAAGLILTAKSQEDAALAAAKDQQLQNNYSLAVAYSQRADADILKATDADKHIQLAKAMQEHNTDYLRLYNTVFDYVPSFMRVRSVSGAASSAESVTVTLTGIIETYQQYADAVLSLLRIPGCVNVVRAGYTINDRYVPNLTEEDQSGTAILPGETNLPSDPQLRWQEIINRASGAPDSSAFQNVEGFGTSETDRGVMPGKSEVTFTITITGMDVMAPDPRATVMSRGAAAPAGGLGGAPAMGAMMGAGGPPPGVAGAPAGRGAGAADADEDM
jgi:hypothetical protein